eukprot:COSAG02_NODE_7884_length_2804_cov_4.795933_3_plen_46_part_01
MTERRTAQVRSGRRWDRRDAFAHDLSRRRRVVVAAVVVFDGTTERR